MNELTRRLRHFKKVFLDTAPIIYFVEKHPEYFAVANEVFRLIDTGRVGAVTSPITLAECLVHPLKRDLSELYQDFLELILHGANTFFACIDEAIAEQAARLRAEFNITLADALQIATALANGCDGFVTNDLRLKRVSAIPMIAIQELKALR